MDPSLAYSATKEKRRYNRWVANETIEDFALRFTARRARKWSYFRVANTAIGSISFLALEAIGGAITLTYGFNTAFIAIVVVGFFLFLTALPISYYAARYGVDIDLLTRGAGFGYIGSTLTSLIYATFTFIFFALEAAILAMALEFCFGIPLFLGYLVSALIVIPLVVNGFSRISAFQAWTQPTWILLHLLPFVLLGLWVGYDTESWLGFNAGETQRNGFLLFGAASGVIFSLIAQVGEQVDYLRFLPEPRTRRQRRQWWIALIIAGPGWVVLGMLKMLAGSYLAILAIQHGIAPQNATDPTLMYHTAFEQVFASPMLVLVLTGAFVILSQLKINITNAYAGSIAWSNFFSRLTHSHPGRAVWLVFNVSIAVMLMELGVFGALEHTLGLYSHVAVAWIGALVADLVINKPLGLSPRGIEFRRAHLFDFNPVGIGAMTVACIISLMAFSGLFGELAAAFSSFIALALAFVSAPLICWLTGGRYYIARPAAQPNTISTRCSVCGYTFDVEDMAHCPFHVGPICSLCCTLDSNCHDNCKPHARWAIMLRQILKRYFSDQAVEALISPLARFIYYTTLIGSAVALLLITLWIYQDVPNFDAVLKVVFGLALIVIGVAVWMYILVSESQKKARREAEYQSERLLHEIRAHERTDRALQAAKDAAEAANLAKTRYMSGLSHELRTPLNSIYGFAQILEKDPDIPPLRRSAITTIRRSSEHLAGLIEGLLDISRIEAGRLEISYDRINLPLFLRQITTIFEETARKKSLEFSMATQGRLPEWITFDEKRLRQILINLLSNAIRYTESGEVTLKLSYRNEVALIEVSDTGSGIATDDLERIWRPFERGQYARGSGSGLGLTITKLLVEILGGQIEVDSTLGQGSRFRVRLMLPSIPDRPQIHSNNAAEPHHMPHVSGYIGTRRTIMVVDDDRNHLELIEQFLQPLGFTIVTANSAEQALNLLKNLAPDLFILDIDLPERDGWSLATMLRSGDYLTTPIVMISGHAMNKTRPQGDPPLYNTFLAKPYNIDELLHRLSDLLRLELVMEEPQLPAAVLRDSQLSAHECAELKMLASNGMAQALNRKLAELEQRGALGGEFLAELRACAEVFDMGGIIRLLEATRHVTP